MPRLEYNDPWLLERSRAMRAEMDAAPQDKATQDAIIDRHVRAAVEARPDLVDGDGLGEAHLLGDLLFASPAVDHPERFQAGMMTFIEHWSKPEAER